jgi:hypothetical protein
MRKMSKRSMKKTITVLTSIIFALILSECLLRVIGFEPWSYESLDANEPTMHAPDPVLGWRNKKGDYVVPPYHPSGKPIYITFQENGQRRTGVDSTNTEGEIVIVGGSCSQGWAVSDNETYAWKLQQKYPSLKVVNYGTGGYGSYQSLLVLEQELPRMTSPKFVLYGFIDHHEVRNVAPESWLRTLSSYSRRGHVDAPFATFDDNNGIVRHLPEGYLSLPLRESLAIIELIERAYFKIKTRKRFKQRRMVTEAILLQMDKVSKEYGATLFVVLLYSKNKTKSHYMGFFKQNNIQFIDSVYPLTKEMRVPGEGHPNGKLHALWAQRISSVLDDQLKKINSSSKPMQSTR